MKEQNWKLSIIIPVYNAEKVISNCIHSILVQNYDNIELLLINDGSTDSTKRIKEFQQLVITEYNLQKVIFSFLSMPMIK